LLRRIMVVLSMVAMLALAAAPAMADEVDVDSNDFGVDDSFSGFSDFSGEDSLVFGDGIAFSDFSGEDSLVFGDEIAGDEVSDVLFGDEVSDVLFGDVLFLAEEGSFGEDAFFLV
jgi:hypothetical protein